MLKLWGRPTSGRTHKVLWPLEEIGLKFDFILASATMGRGGSVEKGNTPLGVVNTPEYRAKNSNGRVPTIDDDGFVLWESNSIVRYLAMQYAPDLLYGNDIRTLASASRWLDWENNDLLPPQHDMVMHLVRLPENQRDPAKLAKARADFEKRRKIADDKLAQTRFICGDPFTYGDIPLGMRVHRWHGDRRGERRICEYRTVVRRSQSAVGVSGVDGGSGESSGRLRPPARRRDRRRRTGRDPRASHRRRARGRTAGRCRRLS